MDSHNTRLLVDRGRCEGFGFCEQTAPELLHLDDDDELVIDVADVPAALADRARAAVNACPVTALRLDRSQSG